MESIFLPMALRFRGSPELHKRCAVCDVKSRQAAFGLWEDPDDTSVEDPVSWRAHHQLTALGKAKVHTQLSDPAFYSDGAEGKTCSGVKLNKEPATAIYLL